MTAELNVLALDIAELYKADTGKVSDKWELYLREYERLLSPYRQKPVSLLEIGIQNGGSLERWGQYFQKAARLVGCDINEDCRKLRYDDRRIAVVVGDANAPDVSAQILALTPAFDIIIDDGSHRSSDIVKSFDRFFPSLKSGGVFIAEDLHCSYWKDYEGGLSYPLSAVAFFKRLADVVSHEHWGVPLARRAILSPFAEAYGCAFNEDDLAMIHSVEFINSICVVTKRPLGENTLGRRIVSGHEELVWAGAKALRMQPHVPVVETGNEWSEIARLPELESAQLKASVAALRAERDELVTTLANTKGDCAAVVRLESQLRASLAAERSAHMQAEQTLAAEVFALRNSTSWRITAPLRRLGSLFK